MNNNGIYFEPEKFMIAESCIKNITNDNYKEKVLNYPADYEYSSESINCANNINSLFLSIDKLYENVVAARNRLATISPEFGMYLLNQFRQEESFFLNSDSYINTNFSNVFFSLDDIILGKDNINSLYTSFFGNNLNNSNSGTFGVDQGSLRILMYQYNNGSYFSNSIDSRILRNKLISKYTQKYNMTYDDACNFLKSIDTTGVCTYASFCNEVYASYLGREEEFKNDFGFEMYRNDFYGNKVLNSEEFLADVYLYMNLDTNGGKLLSETNGNINVNYTIDSNNLKIFDTEQQQYLTTKNYSINNIFLFNTRKEGKIDDYLKSHNNNLEYKADSVFTKEPEKLIKIINSGQSNNKQYSLSYCDNTKKENEIIMYDSNDYAYSIDTFDGSGHSVYITEANSRGLVVSSWGKKYTIEWDDLEKVKDQFDIIEAEIEGMGK